LGLLLGGAFEGAGEQPANSSDGDFFHLVEGDIEPGAALPPVLADNNFAPLVSEVGDALEISGGEFRRRHNGSVPGVAKLRCDEISV
jgi:hypothetical protein